MEKGKVEFQDKGIIRTLMNKGILMKGLLFQMHRHATVYRSVNFS